MDMKWLILFVATCLSAGVAVCWAATMPLPLPANPGDLAWSDGTNTLTTGEVANALCAMDGMHNERLLLDKIRQAGAGIYPVYVEFVRHSDDPRLVAGSLAVLQGVPAYLKHEHQRLVELFANTNMISQALFLALARVVQQGDEKLIAPYLDGPKSTLVAPAIKALRDMNTAASLREIESALPRLEKRFTSAESASAFRKLRAELAEQSRRLSAADTGTNDVAAMMMAVRKEPSYEKRMELIRRLAQSRNGQAGPFLVSRLEVLSRGGVIGGAEQEFARKEELKVHLEVLSRLYAVPAPKDMATEEVVRFASECWARIPEGSEKHVQSSTPIGAKDADEK